MVKQKGLVYGLTLVAALSFLTACGGRSAATATLTNTPPPTSTQQIPQATATEAIAPQPEATAVPTITPVAQEPVQEKVDIATLLGDSWTILLEGDFNKNGKTDAIAYQPTSITRSAETLQGDYASYEWTVFKLIIVEQRETGDLQADVKIIPGELMLHEESIISFDQSTAGFILKIDEEQSSISLIPLNGEGGFYTQGVGISWDEAQQSYQLLDPAATE